MVIYKTTNLINNRFYIGKDKNNNPSYMGSGLLLKQAIVKYGIENFKKEILEVCNSESDMNEREIYWITELRDTQCYNIADGGDGGDVFTHHPNKELYRARLKVATTKLWESDEYASKVKAGLQKANDETDVNQRRSDTVFITNKSPEVKKRRSDAMIKVLESPEKRKIWSDCKTGSKNGRWLGNVIVTELDGTTTKFESAVDASNTLKVAAHGIRLHCKNNTTYSRGIYKGWKFRLDSSCEIT